MKENNNTHGHVDEKDKDNDKIQRRNFLGLGLGAIALGAIALGTAIKVKDLLPVTQKLDIEGTNTVPEIAEFIMKHAQPVDYGKIWDKATPILLVGDRNMYKNQAEKNEIAFQLANLKKEGLTDIVITDVNKGDQGFVDEYLADQKSKDELLKLLMANLVLDADTTFLPLFESAKREKIHITVHVDPLLHYSSQYENWGKVIQNIVSSNKNARVLVFLYTFGIIQSNRTKTFPFEFEKHKIPFQSVSFAGGIEGIGEKIYTSNVEEQITKATGFARKSAEKFVIPLRQTDTMGLPDFVIHLPE